jgi:catabolite regulation protein CreA
MQVMKQRHNRGTRLGKTLLVTGILLLGLFIFEGSMGKAAAADDNEVGRFANDWTGNDVVIDALADPKVEGVTCRVTHFDRGLFDRRTNGNWFEDPSNSSIACRQTGPVPLVKLSSTQKATKYSPNAKA